MNIKKGETGFRVFYMEAKTNQGDMPKNNWGGGLPKFDYDGTTATMDMELKSTLIPNELYDKFFDKFGDRLNKNSLSLYESDIKEFINQNKDGE